MLYLQSNLLKRIPLSVLSRPTLSPPKPIPIQSSLRERNPPPPPKWKRNLSKTRTTNLYPAKK